MTDMPPGEPPLRNWQPATTFKDYVRNCDEGLEEWSQRRAAKLLGVARIELYRWRLMAELPEALFEELLAADITSTKALAAIALALKRGTYSHEVERCPHCGHPVRVRRHVNRKAADVIVRHVERENGEAAE